MRFFSTRFASNVWLFRPSNNSAFLFYPRPTETFRSHTFYISPSYLLRLRHRRRFSWCGRAISWVKIAVAQKVSNFFFGNKKNWLYIVFGSFLFVVFLSGVSFWSRFFCGKFVSTYFNLKQLLLDIESNYYTLLQCVISTSSPLYYYLFCRALFRSMGSNTFGLLSLGCLNRI